MKKTTKIQIYFYSILTLSVLWLIILPKPFKNFAPIFFIIPTFPFFIFKYSISLFDFSKELKILYPELFKKYVVDYGNSYFNGIVVEIGITYKNQDFENLENENLLEMYSLCKQFIELAIASFVILAILGIGTVYL